MKNKSISKHLAAVIAAAMLGAALAAGCGNSNAAIQVDTVTETEASEENGDIGSVDDATDADSNGSDSSSVSGTGTQDESDPDFNHGHSISETESSERSREIMRSYDVVIHDSAEALEYLEGCVPSEGTGFTYELTDTSDDDPGAYMWYEFCLSYDDTVIDGTGFTVLAFTDGTIVEGFPEFLTYTAADKSNALSAEDVLQLYMDERGDNRQYIYKGSGYICAGRNDNVFHYAYTYRYDCGHVLENITLVLDAETGEVLGYRPDAID